MHPAYLSRRIRNPMQQEKQTLLPPLQPLPACIMAILAGTLLILPFRVQSLYIVTWFALVPLLIALRGQKPRTAIGLGWLAGTTAHIIGVYWLVGTMVRFGGIYLPASVALFLVIAAALGTIYIPFVLACRLVPGRLLDNTLRGALFIAAAFTACEFIFPSAFPWRIGYTQMRIPALVQIADITGVYGITFITAFAGAVLYQLIISIRTRSGNYPWAAGTLLIILVAAYVGYGLKRLETVRTLMAAADHIRVALLQPNVPFDEKFNPDLAAAHNKELFDMSVKAAARKATLIVWPETGYRSPILGSAKRIDMPVKLPAGTYLYVGANVFDRIAGGYAAHNSTLAVAPDGTIVDRYDKHHLFPFGEYLPLSDDFPFLKKYAGPISDFKPGTGPPIKTLPNGITIGPLICYEDIFPELSRRAVKRGARLLVNQTNDAWFGNTAEPHQHLQLARFRSIENRITMVRATNSGITAIVSPTGAVVRRLKLFTKGSIVADVPEAVMTTFYTRYGNVFAYLCLFAVLATLAWRVRGRYRTGPAAPGS